MEGVLKRRLLSLVACLVIIPTLEGHMGDFNDGQNGTSNETDTGGDGDPVWHKSNIAVVDEVWEKRAQEAKEAALEAHHPNPAEITDHLNHNVHLAFEEEAGNRTRRLLGMHNKKSLGPCEATNPIDRCWRCDKNWAKNRKKLADCALGFGHKATGGKAGKIYVVTDSGDCDLLNPKPGTLRYGVIQKEPLWIIFAHDMHIRLTEELLVASHKTIDGRGVNVHIAYGAQITLQFVKNIIIHNLHVHHIIPGKGGMIRDSVDHYGLRTRSDGDGISLFGATNVWIDHISMSRCYDGLVDAVMESTAVTLSNCHFTHHNEVSLFGASNTYPADKVMQITVAFNHFGQGLVQRMPRCRFGFFHVVNNDYTHWLDYAIGGSNNPTILSQGNRFIAPLSNRCKEITKRDYASPSEWKNWNWRSEKDLFMNGAFFVQSGKKLQCLDKGNVISAKSGNYATRLTRWSGALCCKEHQEC